MNVDNAIPITGVETAHPVRLLTDLLVAIPHNHFAGTIMPLGIVPSKVAWSSGGVRCEPTAASRLDQSMGL